MPIKELLVRSADGAARIVRLDSDRLVLGRSASNELCYPDDGGLSRQHLAFERDGDGWAVVDLGSKNGTRVNGDAIQGKRRLQAGDQIAASRVVIVYDAPRSATEVMFVPDKEAEVPASMAMSTSLQGVLASEVIQPSTATAERPRSEANRVSALIRAGRELAGHRPLADLFNVILDLSIDSVGAQRGVLMTLEGEELVVRASRGEGFRISTAVHDRVLKAKDSLLVRDVQKDASLRERQSIVQQSVRTLMAVPLGRPTSGSSA